MRPSRWALLGVACALTLAACGSRPVSHPTTYDLTTFSGRVAQLQASSRLDACDRSVAATQRQIAASLDSHAAQIAALAASQPVSDAYKDVPMGPTTAREPASPVTPAADQWVDGHESWATLAGTFAAIESAPVDTRWLALQSAVDSILVDDATRLIEGADMALDRDSQANLQALADAANQCLANNACVTPAWPSTALAFAGGDPLLAPFVTQTQPSLGVDAARLRLKTLVAQLQVDLSRYNLYKNATVTRNGNDLVMPLVAGVFASAQDQVAGYIEAVWQSPQHQLHVQWVSRQDAPDAFGIVLEDGPYGRSYVDYSDRNIHVYPYVRSRALAHETGHVLGLQDHYYTVRDTANCQYLLQTNLGDIMSDVDTGGVTADDWAALFAAY